MSHTRTVWEEGHEPGRAVAALGMALALSIVVLDIALMGRVSLIFDITFAVLCVGLALAVRPTDFFTVGVLPPLIMLTVFVLLGLTRPGTIADSADGAVQAVVSGLGTHCVSLGIGYALCLAVLLLRRRYARADRPPLTRTATGPQPPLA